MPQKLQRVNHALLAAGMIVVDYIQMEGLRVIVGVLAGECGGESRNVNMVIKNI
jgi:hypothetical protein